MQVNRQWIRVAWPGTYEGSKGKGVRVLEPWEVENLSGGSALSVRSVKVLKMQEPELVTRALTLG